MECEWSAMVVPTYPEGGNHALKVCQLLAPPSGCARESAAVSGCQDSKNTLCSRLHRPIRLKPSRVS
jgi:hypothetical protein